MTNWTQADEWNIEATIKGTKFEIDTRSATYGDVDLYEIVGCNGEFLGKFETVDEAKAAAESR